MATFTTRLALTKPAGSEARSVTPLNTNADLIDKFAGCILVNDGVTPPTGDLFDGAIVKERTSGIIWEARKNGGGTFDKVYIRYPFDFAAEQGSPPINAGSVTTYTTWDSLNTYIDGKNSSAANIAAKRFVVPVKGIYYFRFVQTWQANGAGIRAISLIRNGAGLTGEFETLSVPNPSFQHENSLQFMMKCDVGDTFTSAGWQNSGGALNLDNVRTRITMIEPMQ
jgi:hypothetical protein